MATKISTPIWEKEVNKLLMWTWTWQLTINSVHLRDMSLGSQPGWCVRECKGAVRRRGCSIGLHPQSILALQPTPAITQQRLEQSELAVWKRGGVFTCKALRVQGIPLIWLKSKLTKPSCEHSKQNLISIKLSYGVPQGSILSSHF